MNSIYTHAVCKMCNLLFSTKCNYQVIHCPDLLIVTLTTRCHMNRTTRPRKRKANPFTLSEHENTSLVLSNRRSHSIPTSGTTCQSFASQI